MFHRKKAELFSERQQRIYDFLNSNRAGVLSTVDPNCEPHGVVIYHAIDKEFNVLFLTRRGTRKYDNIIRNNHIVYTVFEPSSQTVAQVIGEAFALNDLHDINQTAVSVFMTSLKTSEVGVPPIEKLQAGEYVAFKIKPKQIRLASYARPDSGDYNKIFESIESFELVTSGV